MTPKIQITSLCHSHIEKLDIQARCIIENDAETNQQNLFTFTRIRYDDEQINGDNLNGSFKVHTKSNKMKYQGNQFSWYRNRNIPSIKVKKEDEVENCIPTHKKSNNHLRNDVYTFYINACYIEKNKFVVTSLKGESLKQDHCQCSFDSLKFEKTSYILNGSCVRLFIIVIDPNGNIAESYISSQIHISSWKNYLKDKPSRSSIFAPFMPSILNRIQIVAAGGSSSQRKNQITASTTQPIVINDNIQGLSDYFKGSTIKQKICHPLFLAIKFAHTISLYISDDLLPVGIDQESNRLEVELFINIHKYFIESLCSKNNIQKKIAIEIRDSQKKVLDEKVREFLKKIYSDFVLFANKKDEFLSKFHLFSQDNLENMQLAYKLAFPKLEMMLLSFQKYHLIEKQKRFYQQDNYSEKDENSECLYSIPKLEITLSKEFVNSEFAIKLPVLPNQPNQSIFLSQSSSAERQRINSISSCGQRITQRLSSMMLSSKQNSPNRNADIEPHIKKQIKKQSYQQDSKSLQESIQGSLSYQDQVQNKKSTSIHAKSPPQNRNMINQEREYDSLLSNYNQNSQNLLLEQDGYSNKLENTKVGRLSQTNQEIRTAQSPITSYEKNKKANNKISSLEHQYHRLKIEDQKSYEQSDIAVSEHQSNCQSSNVRSQHSNFDCQNTEINSIQLIKNPSINNSTSVNQQSQTLIPSSNPYKSNTDTQTLTPKSNTNNFPSDQKINNQISSNFNQSQSSQQQSQQYQNFQSFPQQNSFNLNTILPPTHPHHGMQIYMPNPGYQIMQILPVPQMGFQPLVYQPIQGSPSPHLNFQQH